MSRACLTGADSLAGLDENEEAACELVKTSLGYLRVLVDYNEIQQDQAPPVVYTGSVGRPKFEITREQINFLIIILWCAGRAGHETTGHTVLGASLIL